MGTDGSSRYEREIELVDTQEAAFKGSGYDAGLSLDTTPTSRVNWHAQGGHEGRSAYDAKMIADTTPTTRYEPDLPRGSSVDNDTSAMSSDDQ